MGELRDGDLSMVSEPVRELVRGGVVAQNPMVVA